VKTSEVNAITRLNEYSLPSFIAHIANRWLNGQEPDEGCALCDWATELTDEVRASWES
jgi:hypothetical protein